MKFLVKNYSLEEQNEQKLGYLPFSHLPRECANHSAASCSGLALSQSFLLQLYKQLNINWTRKTDWPSGEKKGTYLGHERPSSALSSEPAEVNFSDLLLS